MKIHQTRYAVTAGFGSLAVGALIVAYPSATIFFLLAGPMFVGLFCGIVAMGDLQ